MAKKKRESKKVQFRTIPPKNKRPTVKRIKTTKVSDPYIAQIHLICGKNNECDPQTIKEVLQQVIISYDDSVNNTSPALPLENASYNYNSDDDDYWCSISPTPHPTVEGFFSSCGSSLTVTMVYHGDNADGHPISELQVFPDVEYEDQYPTD